MHLVNGVISKKTDKTIKDKIDGHLIELNYLEMLNEKVATFTKFNFSLIVSIYFSAKH